MIKWKDIHGYEGLYQISSDGRVKSLPFLQRYTHWRTGEELFRQTKERILSVNIINSGYAVVQLWKNDKGQPFLIHRLVAEYFLQGSPKLTVNHKDGNKLNNKVSNLEWASYSENLKHAVINGLNHQAKAVVDPVTGIRYPSITQAAKQCRRSPRTIRASFLREGGSNG
ncbi:NUMOD4 motif [Klebsiella pneumoniae subsp. rhinoscleromatis]|uniref:NUMOD4 motif n=1 Tax=Klebsiella pneumoniae TaxID=573 RepID=A0A2X3CVK9_KLEPN|nr:NUMOD4 domain-containing protein [Klebsiella pneumoniae]STV37836.1 NUMOD4 motif [Klebsiella pneumoniae subsp. rhinoscleromatis]SQC20898.1 NUMOD4 motif [Klebsiella pneumoniae]STT67342.1 NUMOD4 motif [Klebsiella pneumoniae]STU45027.1 NUMOD4 motif [Klebsiella pneumoniae]STV76931.1 NUMOD4 motif [Klebsiella pneumoniae subsp. rhinoscleromatis]